MTRDPTVEHYGTKWQQVVVEYETQEVGELTAQAMSSEGLFQMKLRPVPSTAGRKPQFNPEDPGRTKATLFVGNLSFETSEDSLREALEQRAGELQNLESVSVARHKDTNVGRGFGFLVFSDEASALAALERLRGAEVDGRKVRSGLAGGAEPRERRTRGSQVGSALLVEGKSHHVYYVYLWSCGAVTVTIFVDELSMPSRPHLEPFAEDREVWVDPLLDESGGHEWLQEFGALEGVFRVPDVGTGEETERGYARFTTHEAAERCVRSGCATWSESERTPSAAISSIWAAGLEVGPWRPCVRGLACTACRDGYPGHLGAAAAPRPPAM
ncbi:unnamed protein product [Prorocentrum cordatum]|uniref:RRM domain-containing protein n=1 Tax=Prorocentrum cordatum TaxID=2364126 RepID=A0ABN9QK00_9DINO|nr:unnamed protein product [Polarella glacialis]